MGRDAFVSRMCNVQSGGSVYWMRNVQSGRSAYRMCSVYSEAGHIVRETCIVSVVRMC